MRFRFKGASILSSVVVASGYAGLSFSSHSPPPPPYNPQITYFARTGATTTITVSNADGSDVATLYSTKNITSGLKFAPNGNRIVFVEQNAIKVLTYAISANGVQTAGVTTLTNEPYQPLHVDVSPDGTELLFTEKTATPGQYSVYVMSMNGGAPTPISLAPDTYYDAVWAHSSSRIAVIQGGPVEAGFGVQTIQVIDLNVGSNYSVTDITIVFTSTVSQLYQVSRLESAHTSDTLLFTATSGSNIGVYTVDIGTMSVSTAPLVTGSNASLSADDSTILFVGPTVANLFTLNFSSDTQAQITSKVALGDPDILP